MTITEYGAQQWAGIMFGVGSLPADFYVALLTAEPGDGWDGTVLATIEPDDPGVYGRPALPVGTAWTLTDGGYVINAAQITYGAATVDWGNITHFGLTDDPTAGELWTYSWFLEPIFVQAGLAPVLGVGSIFFALGNQLPTIGE